MKNPPLVLLKRLHSEGTSRIRLGTKCTQIMVPRLWNNDGSIILGNDEDLNIKVKNKCVDTLCLYNC